MKITSCLTIASLVFFVYAAGSHLWGAESSTVIASPLTDKDYSVRSVRSAHHLISCGAVNRVTKPPIFLNENFLRSGAISIVADYFALSVSGEKTQAVPISIGGRRIDAQAIVDGRMITFGLSKSELKSAIRLGISINEIQIDKETLQHLHALVSRCLSQK